MLHNLSLLNVLGTDVFRQFIVLTLAQVESFDCETAYSLAVILYLAVLLNVNSGEFTKHIL